MIQQILLNENRIFILYHNKDLKIFTSDFKGNFKFEMKFNFSTIKIKKFIFLKEKSSFIIIDHSGKLYSFYYPNLKELVEINKENDIYLNLSQIEEINIFVNDIFSIKDYLIFLDEKENLFYIHENNLGLNFTNKKDKENLEDTENTNLFKIMAMERNYSKIIKISNGENNIMFVDETYRVYYINTLAINSMNTTTISPKMINDFNCKLVQEIASGESHWLLLERDDKKPLDKWNELEVQEWFHSMDMDEYLNIIKYEKINGKDIFNADETFFVNIMGMMDDQIKKVKYEIYNVKNVSVKITKLWGWGSNKQGQLGMINYNQTFIKNPTPIHLPEMKHENDFILKVYCGKTFTLLQTKFGELFITGNYSPKEKSTTHDLIQNKPSGGKKNRIVEKKNNQIINISALNRWVNITKEVCFDTMKNYDEDYFFRGKEIHLKENKIYLFGYKSSEIPFTLQAKKPKLKHLKKGEKFPTSNLIIEKVMATKKDSLDKFSLVYEDALLKFLETPLSEFLESEVPYHKIYQIKYYKNIIWDRKKRYCKLDYE